ncbi:hypothetical protein [Arthrobacter sp. efr-133-TYG-118]|uniref:hypothetical protein n=1 Tax=Arthrobacter sp. efr-133-TYG-118 TaxID=3040279 RepID=UPI00254C528B|nr:hypothetical protein [Arthrobacter sp. efr-133-TYG-118]
MMGNKMATTKVVNQAKSSSGALWPWTSRAALLTVPVVLVVLLFIYGFAKAALGWPDSRYEGWVLLGVVSLSLLSVFLLVVQVLAASGARIEVPGGIKISFDSASAQAASSTRSTTLSENLGTPESEPVPQSSVTSILRSLRRAQSSDITVVDLGNGQKWWESRLFILIAGAARRTRPQAIAFIGDRNGAPGVFLGWAAPSDLLEQILASNDSLRIAHHAAAAMTARWQIGEPVKPSPGAFPQVLLPWNNQPFFLPPSNESPDPDFAFELFLQQNVDVPDLSSLRRHVHVQRLRDLFEPVLVTDHADKQAGVGDWANLLTSSPRRFFALTSAGRFQALVLRDALVSALVARLVAEASTDEQNDKSTGG